MPSTVLELPTRYQAFPIRWKPNLSKPCCLSPIGAEFRCSHMNYGLWAGDHHRKPTCQDYFHCGSSSSKLFNYFIGGTTQWLTINIHMWVYFCVYYIYKLGSTGQTEVALSTNTLCLRCLKIISNYLSLVRFTQSTLLGKMYLCQSQQLFVSSRLAATHHHRGRRKPLYIVTRRSAIWPS